MVMRQRPSAAGGSTTGRPRPPSSQNYQNIQPTFEWKQEEGCAVLVVHLPGFLNEQLVVQLLSTDKLRVRGTRQVRANTFIRFDQTYPIPQDCTTTGIQAKFEGGLLSVTFPKKKTAAPSPAPADTTQVTSQEKQSLPQPVKEGKDSTPPPQPQQTVPATSRTEAKSPPPPPPPQQTVPATSRTEAKSPEGGQVDNNLGQPSHGDKIPTDTKTATEAPSSKKASLSGSNEPEAAEKVTTLGGGDKDIGKKKHPNPDHMEKPPPNATEESKEGETNKDSKLTDEISSAAKQTEGGDHQKMEKESNSSSMKADQKKRRVGDGNYNIDEYGKDYQKGTSTTTKNGVAGDDDDGGHTYTNTYGKYKQIVMDLITPKDDEERKLLVNIGVAALIIVALGTYITYSRWSCGRRQ